VRNFPYASFERNKIRCSADGQSDQDIYKDGQEDFSKANPSNYSKLVQTHDELYCRREINTIRMHFSSVFHLHKD
jgi:hypothetical protein